MRTLLILMIISLTGGSSFGQDPVLYEHTWYLHDLIIDGESIPPINLVDASFIPLVFDEDLPADYNFQTVICGIGSGEVSFDDQNSSFLFLQGLEILECCCLSQTTVKYAILYYDFFEDEIGFPFVYSLSSASGNFFLVITSESGNQAIYGNFVLSSPDVNFDEIKVYPNPSSSDIFIESQNDPVIRIQLFNLLGESIQSLTENTDSINISNLAIGVYLLRVSTERGSTVKRIIKQ